MMSNLVMKTRPDPDAQRLISPVLVRIDNDSTKGNLFAVRQAIIFASVLLSGTSPNGAGASISTSQVLASGGSGSSFVAREEDVSPDIAVSLQEIRRRTSLTWSQLADIFGVSMRAVHHWAEGKRVSHVNASKVASMLTFVREMAPRSPLRLRREVLEHYEVPHRPIPEVRLPKGGAIISNEEIELSNPLQISKQMRMKPIV